MEEKNRTGFRLLVGIFVPRYGIDLKPVAAGSLGHCPLDIHNPTVLRDFF